ncbi:uncharacterized protein PFL1_01154 [Pseudozyma flocculosa PF-1]|uniref:uncharacterized protein n=1 Tax=Pseudozyma flocculosa PF-1 TaxID=1277687 RepID=UPI0004560C29|nr:uncharacterized protein PFL1_01154 [Pseudozyma flocculosa PF-1]EPQ30965.1 hypothetical protein PFL1_01154 [Pseudozyma flocculosa PF-1]
MAALVAGSKRRALPASLSETLPTSGTDAHLGPDRRLRSTCPDPPLDLSLGLAALAPHAPSCLQWPPFRPAPRAISTRPRLSAPPRHDQRKQRRQTIQHVSSIYRSNSLVPLSPAHHHHRLAHLHHLGAWLVDRVSPAEPASQSSDAHIKSLSAFHLSFEVGSPKALIARHAGTPQHGRPHDPDLCSSRWGPGVVGAHGSGRIDRDGVDPAHRGADGARRAGPMLGPVSLRRLIDARLGPRRRRDAFRSPRRRGGGRGRDDGKVGPTLVVVLARRAAALKLKRYDRSVASHVRLLIHLEGYHHHHRSIVVVVKTITGQVRLDVRLHANVSQREGEGEGALQDRREQGGARRGAGARKAAAGQH